MDTISKGDYVSWIEWGDRVYGIVQEVREHGAHHHEYLVSRGWGGLFHLEARHVTKECG